MRTSYVPKIFYSTYTSIESFLSSRRGLNHSYPPNTACIYGKFIIFIHDELLIILYPLQAVVVVVYRVLCSEKYYNNFCSKISSYILLGTKRKLKSTHKSFRTLNLCIRI